MRLVRRLPLALLSFAVSLALHGAEVRSSPFPVACGSKPAVAFDFSPRPLTLCLQMDCLDDGDCRNACPGDSGAYCSPNGCVYSSGPGGPGGGGSGGGYCIPMSDCSDNSQCSFCGGYCGIDWICHH